jgi:hypothetical protein
MKTKIILNKKEILLEDSSQQLILEFFDLLQKDLRKLIMNDDGGEKFKNKLKEFDVSEDKEFGGEWCFIINEKSRSLIDEVLRHYIEKQWGHFRYSLVGEDFKISFEEVGDELVFPEYAEDGIVGLFNIEAKGKNLELIESLLEKNVLKE